MQSYFLEWFNIGCDAEPQHALYTIRSSSQDKTLEDVEPRESKVQHFRKVETSGGVKVR